jgi:hypothetical protein
VEPEGHKRATLPRRLTPEEMEQTWKREFSDPNSDWYGKEDAWYGRGDTGVAPGVPTPKKQKNTNGDSGGNGSRRIQITWANTIPAEPVRWGWIHQGEGRMPLGSLSVAAGREGCGKSQFGIWLVARITTGTLPGLLEGYPAECSSSPPKIPGNTPSSPD